MHIIKNIEVVISTMVAKTNSKLVHVYVCLHIAIFESIVFCLLRQIFHAYSGQDGL